MILKEEITALLRALYEASGLRLSLHDAAFGEIAAYPEGLSPFCACVAEKKSLRARCYESDAIAFETARTTGKLYLYRCPMGLYEAVSPIFQDGILMGYLMMGQVFDETPLARDRARDNLCREGVDPARAARVVEQIPICTHTLMEAFASIMTACTGYIAMSNLLRANGESPAEAARQYIEKHYSEKVSIDLLCHRFHCCRATMTSSYKQKYGETINRSINRIRLMHARDMLQAGASVMTASAACGFTDPSYFTKCFHRQFGYSPSRGAKK